MNTKQIIRYLLEEEQSRIPQTVEDWQNTMKKYLGVVTPEQASCSCYILSDGIIAEVPDCNEHGVGMNMVFDGLNISSDDPNLFDPDTLIVDFDNRYLSMFSCDASMYKKTGTVRVFLLGSKELAVSVYIDKVTMEQLATIKKLAEGTQIISWNIGNFDSGVTYDDLVYTLNDSNMVV